MRGGDGVVIAERRVSEGSPHPLIPIRLLYPPPLLLPSSIRLILRVPHAAFSSSLPRLSALFLCFHRTFTAKEREHYRRHAQVAELDLSVFLCFFTCRWPPRKPIRRRSSLRRAPLSPPSSRPLPSALLQPRVPLHKSGRRWQREMRRRARVRPRGLPVRASWLRRPRRRHASAARSR